MDWSRPTDLKRVGSTFTGTGTERPAACTGGQDVGVGAPRIHVARGVRVGTEEGRAHRVPGHPEQRSSIT